jgi:hypothetical protein
MLPDHFPGDARREGFGLLDRFGLLGFHGLDLPLTKKQ